MADRRDGPVRVAHEPGQLTMRGLPSKVDGTFARGCAHRIGILIAGLQLALSNEDTGSESNPYVVITTDDAAIVEAHIGSGENPPHPPKNGREDFIIEAGSTKEDCTKKQA